MKKTIFFKPDCEKNFKNFRGSIDRIDDFRFLVSGEIALIEDENDNKNDYSIEITELPIGTYHKRK